ncbi:MAG TPA: UPF0158 family protein, partial [Polyangiaceae bacterium]|nr:UPF0158 family protein [Polyangiaceae bacterium]
LDLRRRLEIAIEGTGAVRRFKDVLMGYGPERERWFAFRSERLRVFMEAWLAAHALRAVPRPAWPAEGQPPKEPAAVTAEQIAGRRARSSDSLRRQLRDVAESLGARDLEKVLAFAEFVKARRAARGFGPRGDASEATGEAAAQTAVAPADEPATDHATAR